MTNGVDPCEGCVQVIHLTKMVAERAAPRFES